MFRLVKVLNNDTKAEVQLIPAKEGIAYIKGEALSLSNGKATSTTATAVPEYIYLSRNYTSNVNKLEVMVVTEDSIFKVEYTGTLTPYLGMPVCLSTKIVRMDAVSYSTSGKGTIVGIDEEPGMVYVRFRK